jgi:hypothetical protein
VVAEPTVVRVVVAVRCVRDRWSPSAQALTLTLVRVDLAVPGVAMAGMHRGGQLSAQTRPSRGRDRCDTSRRVVATVLDGIAPVQRAAREGRVERAERVLLEVPVGKALRLLVGMSDLD